MLPSSDEVEQVYLDPETGILSGLKDHHHHHHLGSPSTPPPLCIDSTTLDFNRATVVSQKLKDQGAEMLDAPVSGGVVGAKDGTLTFMCGGQESSFQRAKPILQLMGKNSIYCGQSGSGLAAKLANNMLLAVSMIATSEAMLLGQKLGLKPDLLAKVINSSTGRCWSSEINNPAPGALLPTKTTPADRNWEGGFMSKLMAKDLRLATQAILNPQQDQDQDDSSSFPISKIVNQIYQSIESDPTLAHKDFSVVYHWLQNRSTNKNST